MKKLILLALLLLTIGCSTNDTSEIGVVVYKSEEKSDIAIYDKHTNSHIESFYIEKSELFVSGSVPIDTIYLDVDTDEVMIRRPNGYNYTHSVSDGDILSNLNYDDKFRS